MRNGVVGEAASPRSLLGGLPGIYQEDDFGSRWVSAFDDLLAPVFHSLDSLDAYIDPVLTPEDFLSWLASWVGVVLDENWPIERRREFVANAVSLYRLRGTPAGLAAHVRIFTGTDVEVLETGGVSWSLTNGGSYPGEPGPRVRVRVADTAIPVDLARLDRLVAAVKPAHVIHTIELVGGS